MIIKQVDLYNFIQKERNGADGGYLFCYLHENIEMVSPDRKRPAMLVIPGGAYCGICEREGEPVAIKYFASGFQTFLLRYSTKNGVSERVFCEAAAAMRYVRENACEYGIALNKVAAVGFSAGGHLAGYLALKGNEITDEKLNYNVRPDAAVLCYPVVRTTGAFAHKDTSFNLCGDDEKKKTETDLCNLVNPGSAPLFIWHSAEDELVPVENSLMLASAYRKMGLPFALHVFETGRHGQATGETDCWKENEIAGLSKECKSWFSLSLIWLKNRDFNVKD